MTIRRYRTMTQAQFYQLCEWLKQNAESCAGKNYAQAAKAASETLDFEITGAQAKNASEATGVKLSPIQREPVKPDMTEIKSLLGTMLSNQRVLAKVVERTCPRDMKAQIDSVQVNAGRLLRDLSNI